jgi:hypothetical protein
VQHQQNRALNISLLLVAVVVAVVSVVVVVQARY